MHMALRTVLAWALVVWAMPGIAWSEAARPNILWIVVEDTNNWMSCYGETLIETPQIDALAARGVRFDKAFMTAGVCSAARSALALGAMQTTFNAQHHQSSRSEHRGVPVPDPWLNHLPDHVTPLAVLMRQAGYYTFNEGTSKDDFNFVFDTDAFYDRHHPALGFKGGRGGSEWSGRKAGQPFFGQIQLQGGKWINAFRRQPLEKRVDPASVSVPPYYPDHPAIRQEIAAHYDTIVRTDEEVGEIIAALERDGLLESTVVFFFSDHGMRLPRHKQFLYEGGIHVPLIVAGPGVAAGAVRGDLVSGIDITVSTLALASVAARPYMEGRDFFGAGFHREHIIAARDRCDFTIERIRAVRSDRYKYLRNFMTDRPYLQPQYRDGTAYMEAIRQAYREGKLNAAQVAFAGPHRPAEELYDLENDPHETINLADDARYRDVLDHHRRILERWMAETDDKGQYPEPDASLRSVLMQLGDRCVDPVFDRVRGR